MDIVPFVPHRLAKLPQEDGPLAAVLFDANFLAEHPRVTCFVRPRIKGEFSQAQRLADAAERREWLELLVSCNATLVRRIGRGVERQLIQVSVNDPKQYGWVVSADLSPEARHAIA
jgi:hypothetical protein